MHFLDGAIMMGFLVSALFFVRFWAKTHDRLFAAFAIAFSIFAGERIILFMLEMQGEQEHTPFIYLMRLIGFLFIIAAIVDKNRKR
jgi:hypothetical protein